MMRVYHSVFAAVVKSLESVQDRIAAKKETRRLLFPGRAMVDREVARTLCLVLVVSLLATASPSARQTIAGLARESRVRVASWTSPNSLPTKLFRSVADGYGRYENWLSAHVQEKLRNTGNGVSSPHPAGYSAGVGSIQVVPSMIPLPPDAPPVFTDDPLVVGGTIVQALHITQLRDAVNQVRARAGLPAASWDPTFPVASGLPIRASHILELRTRLDEARTALGLPAASYSPPAPSIGGSIRAAHVQEIRDFIKAMLGTTSSGDSALARLDPVNQTGGGGENPLSRNFNWSVPLVGLPGRSGLDLGLSLSYNSLVWTKRGSSSISFNDDGGFPSPGFRLGFPVIQPLYYNSEVGKYAFLLITPDGDHTELRQVNASALYEAADSSHLLLDTATMVLRTTDGTQLSYAWMGGDYQCTQIKDRNGNFITINYTSGRIDTVIDTLARTVKFNYWGSDLTSITQNWTVDGQAVTHYWARFAYADPTIQTNFPNLTVLGPQNNTALHVLTQVKFDDDSHYDFVYTSWGQIWKINNYAADGHVLNYRAYNLPGNQYAPQTDCPRFTTRVDWAENWNRSGSNGTSGLPGGAEQEVLTASWIVPASASWNLPDGMPQTGTLAQVTAADGTYNKIYFEGAAGTSTGWKRALPSLVETYDSGNVRQRQAVSTWTQDNTAVSYPLNPRVTERNIYDPAGNHVRTRVTYQNVSFADGTNCNLPQDVYEYQANAITVLRRTHTAYNLDSAYTSRRIIGLVSEQTLYEVDPNTAVETLMSKVGFQYDETGSIQGTDAPVQHDNTNYAASFLTGRANLSSVTRYDVSNTSQSTVSTIKYNTAGTTVVSIDPLGHQVSISYTDSFSDNNNSRNTLAFPTSVTDPDNFSSTAQYNFDFGSMTRIQGPPPVGQTVGAIKNIIYDSLARIQKVAIEFSGNADYSHARFEYPTSQNRIDTYTTIQEGLGEAHSFKIVDGHGRAIASASDHPGSTGGFSGQLVLYDNVGRAVKTSNPTETSASGTPSQWVAAGDDAQAGWLYTQQTYDWKGRPLATTNTDGTTKEASYSGCGCAGGEVVTLTDETSRQQRTTTDVLARPWRTEILNSDGSAYSTTTNTYNARDQVTLARTYQGTETSNAYQDKIITYDGYGRLKTQHLPEQDASTATTWDYFVDDTVQKVTDARGASRTFSYNGRHLVTGITYDAPAAITIPTAVSFGYDASGNRTSMTDGLGSASYSYDQLSRLSAESRYFNELGQSFSLTYGYNLSGAVASVSEPSQFGSTVIYSRDQKGRVTSVTGSGGGAATYASGLTYRASGDLKHLDYGNSLKLDLSYNNRLLNTQFDVTNSGGSRVAGWQYQYGNDGQLNYSHDLRDDRLDRAYGYDQAKRLVQGFSGSEARGDSAYPYSGPYKQTYGFDVWGNLTDRSMRIHGFMGFPSTSYYHDNYVNNRNTGGDSQPWIYDADGRITNDRTRQYSFDAAGRQIYNSQNSIYRSFDGDGALLKKVENGATTYYLKSSVLGEVITELNQSGQKQRGYVYGDGEVLAKQEGGQVLWNHDEPSGTSSQWTNASGVVSNRAETDPLGTQVDENGGFSGGGFSVNPVGFYGDANNQGGGCAAGGAGAACTSIFSPRRSLGWGIGILIIENPGGSRTRPHLTPYGPNPVPGNRNPYGLIGNSESTRTVIYLSHSWNLGGGHPQEPAPHPGCTTVNADMGESGQGWYRYPSMGQDPGRLNYGQPGVVAALTNFASDWNQNHPNNPIGIGDLSLFGDARSPRHPAQGHPGGNIVDIRPMGNDGVSGPTTFLAATYSRDLTSALVQGLQGLRGDQGNTLVTDHSLQRS